MEMEISDTMRSVLDPILRYGVDVLGAVAILIVGWIAAGWTEHVTRRSLERVPKIEATLRSFLASIARYPGLVFVVIAVLNQFGVQTTSLIALGGAAGLAVGLALQSTLQNVAAGMMLLLLRPFRVGDAIEVDGNAGTVVEVGLFTTELRTADGVFRLVPNAQLWNKPLLNYSRNPTRRIDVRVGLSYGDDVEAALAVLRATTAKAPRVLADPAPQVTVSELGDGQATVTLTCWTRASDYGEARGAVLKTAKQALEVAGGTTRFRSAACA